VALRAAQRFKLAKKIEQRFDRALVMGLAVGHAGPSPSVLIPAFIGGYIGVGVLLTVLTGQLIVVGALPLLLTYNAIARPRFVVFTDHGLAALKKTTLTGAPGALVGQAAPAVVLRPVAVAGRRRQIAVGTEKIWMKDSEIAELRLPGV
jgi:hypothetical protein